MHFAAAAYPCFGVSISLLLTSNASAVLVRCADGYDAVSYVDSFIDRCLSRAPRRAASEWRSACVRQ
jgi:hypothetical protein